MGGDGPRTRSPAEHGALLIRGAELECGARADVRIAAGRVQAIGELAAEPSEVVLHARGGLLLPGLHDHHIHLAALAGSLNSVRCGPPQVTDADAFAACLRAPGQGWLRAVGYHEDVAGLLDAQMLDRIVADRPVRVQHRSGRMWVLNSRAMQDLLRERAAPPGLEREGGRFTGRLFDEDRWLRTALGSRPPSFAEVGARLARRGVTGLTDMTPGNDALMARHMSAEIASGALPQTVLLAGRPELESAEMGPGMTLGPVKLHLHEADMPPLADAVELMTAAHRAGRAVAVHCATEVELMFTLAAFEEAGARPDDRIEHASVADDHAVDRIARLGLAVVSQPHFIAERGEAYLRNVEPEHLPLLYRLRGFLDAGVTLAAGSDAPFGDADPWASMAAAVSRRTDAGSTMGPDEALTPEQALDLYLASPEALGQRRRVGVGAPADLCLLDRPWSEARQDLAAVGVRAAFAGGRRIDDLAGAGEVVG